nr:PRC-barrel domain-containing protein [Brachybacterium sacelli]
MAGVTVLGSDGGQIGRVRDIYLHDATGELAGITVVRRQLSSRSVLIPTAAIDVLPAPHTEPEQPDEQRRIGQADRRERDDQADRHDRADQADRRERADRADTAERSEPAEHTGRQGRAEQSDNADRPVDPHRRATHPRATTRRAADRERRRSAADRDSDPSHPQAMWLRVDADSARAGLHAPDTLHATAQMLREAARAIGLEEAAAG